jgi:hypothetical protein
LDHSYQEIFDKHCYCHSCPLDYNLEEIQLKMKNNMYQVIKALLLSDIYLNVELLK